MKEHRTETDRFREIFDEFVFDSTHLDEQNCTLDFEKSMDHVLKTRGKEDQPKDISETMNSLEIQKYVKHRHDYRMYSFKQLFNIVNTVADNSNLNDRVVKAESNIA